MDLSKKYTKELKAIKIQYRKWLFPYVTRFMDKRIDAILSLFYECDLYTLEDLKNDLCEVLYVRQPFSVMPYSERTPIYTQLTLF